MPTILVIEDEESIADPLIENLEFEGYYVISPRDGLQGMELALSGQADMILLDIMLPGLNGYDICRQLRAQRSDTPIIMLTAKGQEADKVRGLEIGADDYVTKPFSPRELAARVRAVLRRSAREEMAKGIQKFAFGDIVVDGRLREVQVAGERLTLTPTEFRLLTMFMREPGRTFTRDQIIDQVFGYDFDGFDRTVDAHISNFRRKLQKASPDKRQYVHTIYVVGYRFGNE